ncbi:MAG TPA: hypothetical protein VL123_05930 [Candidatus Udaeobacter sp.]|jgi:hypothetical protein|nr:hypothetical protein [Candidatus Udaeobacter sp.]
MKSLASRVLLAALAAVAIWLVLAGAGASRAPVIQPDKLIIASTVDVKGKTSPCG